LRRFRLVKACVRTFNITRLPRGLVPQGKQLTQQLFETYHPEVLVIEKTDYRGSRRSRYLPKMTAAIKALAAQHGITVVEYTPEDMRDALSPRNTRLTKTALCHAIARHDQRLGRYLSKAARRPGATEPYYTALFMAVALGLAWAKQQQRRKAARRKP
jgi:hypothetical protein